MKALTIRNITQVTHGSYHGPAQLMDQEIQSVTTDSRKASSGCLFVPIVGTRVDGHSFIPQVMEAGALVTLSERDLEDASFPWIRVQDSVKAMGSLAAFYLKALDIPVVGITGSVGKTSTKELVARVLEERYQVLKTQGNYNNELGLPLTIFRLTPSDEIAVLEMGISDFGEMRTLASIACPDTAVITNIGTCHLENLGDRDGVLRAKTEMLDYVRENGHIVLNGDDDKLITVKEKKGIRPVFCHVETKGSVHAEEVECLGLEGTRARFELDGESFEAVVPVPGKHMIANALIAACVGKIYGLTVEEIRQGIEHFRTIDGRFHLVETGRWTVIDDCYNANPMSMKASADILKGLKGRRVAVLGDMGELGKDEAALHEEVGRYFGRTDIDLLVGIGPLCSYLVQGALSEGKSAGDQVIHLESVDDFLAGRDSYLREGDQILVKASRFMHFEKIVDALCAEGSDL